MLDHLDEESLDRVQRRKLGKSGGGGGGYCEGNPRLLSPVSSPSLVMFDFCFRPFKIIDEELPVKITYNIGYLLVCNIEKPRSFEFE